jgi:uncharacterized membrane protein YbhN (UPF0104 family)
MAGLLLANTLTSLLSGILPVPGGIGVSEMTLIALLVALGIPQSRASPRLSFFGSSRSTFLRRGV